MAQSVNTWGKKIKRARDEKGWSQVDLASKIGEPATQRIISLWERGISKPNPYYRQRLSEVLGKSQEELGFLENIDEPPLEDEGEKIKIKQTPSLAKTLMSFFKRREVLIALVIVGVVTIGVLIFFLTSVSQKETVTFPLTAGINGAPTKYSYSGTTTITVSGTGQVAEKFYSDAFYMYANDKGQPIEPKHDARFLSLCINGLPVDRFVKTIPLPSTNHIYSFQINAPGGLLTFGICDDGVSDNTGSFTVTISQGVLPFSLIEYNHMSIMLVCAYTGVILKKLFHV